MRYREILRENLSLDGLPDAVVHRAEQMYADVKGKPHRVGDSDVVDGYWIETHTLGCRNEGGDSEENWWDEHWKFYDKYTHDGVSVVAGDPEEGTFVTITPQRDLEESLDDDYSHGGGWIDDNGNFEECNHRGGVHHSDLAMDAFGEYIEPDDETGEHDEHSYDAAMAMAYDEGWIQVSTKGHKAFYAGWRKTPSPAALKTLFAMISNDPMPYEVYETETPALGYKAFDNVKAFIGALRRSK